MIWAYLAGLLTIPVACGLGFLALVIASSHRPAFVEPQPPCWHPTDEEIQKFLHGTETDA